MFNSVGKNVVYLKRISFGPMSLPEDLPEGEYRELTQQEVNLLKNI
jgi:16S rRNA pseudouridine516 synthase